MRLVYDEQGGSGPSQIAHKPLVLHPLGGQIQQPEFSQMHVLNDPIPFRLRQTGMKGRCRDTSRAKRIHLIFH